MRDKPLVLIAGVVVLVVAAVAFVAGEKIGHGKAGSHAMVGMPASAAPPSTTAEATRGQQIDPLRRGIPISEEGPPPPMARVENTDIRRNRAYPMQPPTIPHSIDNYQVDKNSNRCLLCHARANADKFQAPPISVTHYMDRNDQFLATISPRRYFCNQCHVVQTDAKPLVANTFKDIDTVLSEPKGN